MILHLPEGSDITLAAIREFCDRHGRDQLRFSGIDKKTGEAILVATSSTAPQSANILKFPTRRMPHFLTPQAS